MIEKNRPDFLIFIVDQMNGFCIGAHDHPDVKTPNLDRLCQKGTSFTRAYCSSPTCVPARASFFTGLTASQHGLWWSLLGSSHPNTPPSGLSNELPIMPRALSDAGYRTHYSGKFHLQAWDGAAEENDYYDENYKALSLEARRLWDSGKIKKLPEDYYGCQSSDFLGGHVSYIWGEYINDLKKKAPEIVDIFTDGKASRQKANYRMPDSSEKNAWAWRLPADSKLHYNQWLVDRSGKFLDSLNNDENFFLTVSFPDPHAPFATCKPYCDMFDPASLTLPETWNETSMPLDFLEDFANDKSCHCRGWDEATLRESLAQTYGMIAHIDDCVGQILAKLEGKGLAENTVIAFISDHGDYLGSHGLLFKGYFPFEGDRRVPFIWNAPDGVSQGLRKEVVSNLDFVPTILDFAGIDQTKYLEDINRNRENPVKLIGRSLREAIEKGKELAPSPALIEHYEYRAGPALAQLSHRILVEENFKICFYDELNKGVLYDLEKDPEERINLWDNPEYQLIKSEMLQRLESLRKEEINIRITKFNRTFN